MKPARYWVLPMFILLTLTACDRRELSGPPKLRLGLDQCAECGMIINEPRYSSALLIERDGQREHVVFDDIGCMLDYESHRDAEPRVLDRFGHDYVTSSWVRSVDAMYLCAEPRRLRTPMGSGIVAFSGLAAAESSRGEFGGELREYAQLASARRALIDARARQGGDGR